MSVNKVLILPPDKRTSGVDQTFSRPNSQAKHLQGSSRAQTWRKDELALTRPLKTALHLREWRRVCSCSGQYYSRLADIAVWRPAPSQPPPSPSVPSQTSTQHPTRAVLHGQGVLRHHLLSPPPPGAGWGLPEWDEPAPAGRSSRAGRCGRLPVQRPCAGAHRSPAGRTPLRLKSCLVSRRFIP